jgi:hypothetical protein
LLATVKKVRIYLFVISRRREKKAFGCRLKITSFEIVDKILIIILFCLIMFNFQIEKKKPPKIIVVGL